MGASVFMEKLMEDLVKIEFEIAEGARVYRDTLYLPLYHGLTEEELGAMKQARYDEWVALINESSEALVE